MVERELRERQAIRARRRARRRLGVALALSLVLHLVGLPFFVGIFRFEPAEPTPAPPVEMVQLSAAAWDQAMAEAREAAERASRGPSERPEASRPEQPERPEKEEVREPPPGQVVEVAPGNGEETPDARFASETSNRVERETIARNRRAGEPVTMPRQTVETPPPELFREGPPQALARGEPGREEGPSGRRHVEIPMQERRDGIAAPEGRPGEGDLARQRASDEIPGNSDRFRIELGEGEGEGDGVGDGGGGEFAGELRLFPSGAVVDRIVGGPAPDHVEGVEEGDSTFLNTREWKYATFFNRVKRSVARTWDPISVLRVRDPTGNVYAWKDRVTLLSVVLREDGSIADMWVERSSGVDFLDREAMAAFERAQPFPNPPRGLMDERGLIQFSFGFYLQTQEPFRIFRRF